MKPLQPFKIEIPQSTLDDLQKRIDNTRWPDQLPDTGWDYGVPVDYVKTLTNIGATITTGVNGKPGSTNIRSILLKSMDRRSIFSILSPRSPVQRRLFSRMAGQALL